VRDEQRHGDHLVLVNRTSALAKVAEKQANRLVQLRGNGRVLQTVPGTTFTSRCELTVSTGVRPPQMPEQITAPPLSLRQYDGPVCVPGQVLVDGNLLLPDTYRHNQRRRLANQYTVELGRRFAAVEAELDDVPLLEGTYLYLDNEVRGHFGHALTEQLSLLWALGAARQHAGDLRPLMTARRRPELHRFERELLAAAGLPPEDVVLLHSPARAERLLAATPTFSMPQYVHPLVARVWAEVGDALAARATLQPSHDRIFVGRRTSKRACLNAGQVEALFVERGFTVVYPEDLSLPDQVALFRRAQVVAGYAGSGLFTLALVPDPKTVIRIGSEAYSANNEYLIASVVGHRLVSVVSRTHRTEDEERRNAKQFQSSFVMDLEREGRFLREILADL
jgi:capsular polysaccharide biosynthesis protein